MGEDDPVTKRVTGGVVGTERRTQLRFAVLTYPEHVTYREIADAGIQHLIIELSQPYDRQFLRRFAKDILPEFQ